jgi:uncharacterized protein
MTEDAANDMKSRLRADLRAAMKDRLTMEAKVIRALIAAIDNAEAPPVPTQQSALSLDRFRNGSAEVERLLLSGDQVRDVLLAEIRERERAAAEFDRLQMTDRAEGLRAEARVARCYVDE